MTIFIILLIVVLGLVSLSIGYINNWASARQRFIYHLSHNEIEEVTNTPQPCRVMLGVGPKALPGQVCIIDEVLKINYENGESATVSIRDSKKIVDSGKFRFTIFPQSSKALAFKNDGSITILFFQSWFGGTSSALFFWPDSKTNRAQDRIAVAFYLRAKDIRDNTQKSA
jgi:hypothetical protein